MILAVDPHSDWGWIVSLIDENFDDPQPTLRFGPYATIQLALQKGEEERARRISHEQPSE